MKNKRSPSPSKEQKEFVAQLEAARSAVKHLEENGQTGTYYHELAARLEAALESQPEDIDDGSQIK